MIDWEAQFSAALIADDHHPTQAEGPAQMPGRIGNGTASQLDDLLLDFLKIIV